MSFDNAHVHPSFFEGTWPRLFRDRLIDPGSGVVRIRRPRPAGAKFLDPIEISSQSARELASAVEDSDHAELLREAADEADRQLRMLGELLGAAPEPAWG